MTIGIVGLGLIGGSIGLALREPGRKIIGYDPDPKSIKTATDRFCIDASTSLEEVAKADVVFVAVPPLKVVAVLEELVKLKGEQTVISDCTSVKSSVAEWAIATKQADFVVGHPMAGHESSGAAFASAWMYRGAKWILSPTVFTSKTALKKVEVLVKAMGAIPVSMNATQHDRQIATISHLPHALAAVLVQMKEQFDGEDVSGGSWKDLTRVGGADPNLWTQIFLENRVELSKSIEEMEKRLAELRTQLDSSDAQAVRQFFERSRKAKKFDK